MYTYIFILMIMTRIQLDYMYELKIMAYSLTVGLLSGYRFLSSTSIRYLVDSNLSDPMQGFGEHGSLAPQEPSSACEAFRPLHLQEKIVNSVKQIYLTVMEDQRSMLDEPGFKFHKS